MAANDKLNGLVGNTKLIQEEIENDIHRLKIAINTYEINIGILEFNLTKEKEFHSKIMLQNTKTHRIYSDKLVFLMIELKKVKYPVDVSKTK